jgi:hypothetical protein
VHRRGSVEFSPPLNEAIVRYFSLEFHGFLSSMGFQRLPDTLVDRPHHSREVDENLTFCGAIIREHLNPDR